MKQRTIAVAVIDDGRGNYLICKMPQNRGVYPGKWAFPGGGMEAEETIEETLHREIQEEVGLKVTNVKNLLFDDDRRQKKMADGSTQDTYMVFCLFTCKAINPDEITINDEFEDYAWASLDEIFDYDLNPLTERHLNIIKNMDTTDNCNQDDIHEKWYHHPKGLIPRGSICPKCARFNSRDIVCITIPIKNHQVLLIKRDIEPCKGWWALPGGYLDWDETLEEGATRELREEAGIEAEEITLFKAYSNPGKDPDGRQNVVMCYVVKPKGEASAGHESSEAVWFNVDDLPKQIAFGHDKVINEYIGSIKQ